jgi:hypothetical protein
MNLYNTVEIKHALVIHSDDLTNFIKSLSEGDQKPDEIIGYTVDGSTVNFSTSAELLNYENRDSKKLIGLKFKGEKNNTTFNINLGKAEYSHQENTIKYNSDSLNHIETFENEVLTRVAEMKPYYNFFLKLNLTVITPILLFSWSIFLNLKNIIIKLNGGKIPPPDPSNNVFSESEKSVMMWGIVAICIAVGFLLEKGKEYLFPTFCVAVGKQAKIYRTKQQIASFVFGTVVIGILIELIF